jgi:histidine triad (HIT) family protein
MCIFCEIAKGNIPSKTLYEDENVIAFLDVNPTSAGHTLIVPKKHTSSLLEADEQTAAAVFEAARKLAPQLVNVLHADGINLLSNAKEAAGQSVDHFHVHLIPRYENKEKEAVDITFGAPSLDVDSIYSTLKSEME